MIFLIKKCLEGKCSIEDNWQLSILEKFFYTIKAIICIIFNRQWNDTQWNWYSKDPISVGMHSFEKYHNYEFGMDDASFILITVGYGIFSNWYYSEVSDGWL